MKLLQLQYFVTTCQYNNITKASEALHISQPSISNAIKELEAEFGVMLFHRLNKGISLTQEGKVLLTKAEALLSQAEEVRQIMIDMGSKRNLIRMGVPPMIGTFLFPKMYKGFIAQYPEVKMLTQEYGSKKLIELLSEGLLDLAILPGHSAIHEDFQAVSIARTETVFCVSKKHALAKRKKVDVPTIKEEALIMFNEGFHQNEIIKVRYSEHHLKPKIIHYSSQFYTIKEFISNDIAVGFMFKDIAKTVPQIVGIPMDPPIQIEIFLVWRKNSHLFNDMVRFIKYATAHSW